MSKIVSPDGVQKGQILEAHILPAHILPVHILEAQFDPEGALSQFRAQHPTAGAIASFIGCVRADEGLSHLGLSHYPGATEPAIVRFGAAAQSRFNLTGWQIIHRIGTLLPAEPIVFVACAAPHRRAAFDAVDYLMDYLKSEAMFWKYEQRGDKKHWIEPRADDYSQKARWD